VYCTTVLCSPVMFVYINLSEDVSGATTSVASGQPLCCENRHVNLLNSDSFLYFRIQTSTSLQRYDLRVMIDTEGPLS
jgi:hypothetical protein